MAKNDELIDRRNRAVARGVAHATTLFADHAENSEVWGADGKRYIDFASGIAVLNTGHRHPKVIEAARAQLDKFTHTAFQVLPYEAYVELAEKLNALAPFKAPAKSVFFSTGAEAVENAVKIARVATRRSGVIAFSGAFHGRTMLTSGLTGKVTPYKRNSGPLPPEVFHIPFPVPHHGVKVADTLAALERLFRVDIDPAAVAAIIIEPVQGEGGFYPAPKELLVELRRVCDTHGIALIVDEIQSGFARTGKMFAIEHSGVEPDLVTIAKSLAGGFPLSGVIGKAALMDAVEPGGLGGTFGGNPVACAAALAVLDVLQKEKLAERANIIGGAVKAQIEAIRRRNSAVPIGEIRGLGAMVAFEIVKDRAGTDPDADATKRVTAKAFENGLILLSCGVFGNVIRILVPLTVSDATLTEGLDKLEQALSLS